MSASCSISDASPAASRLADAARGTPASCSALTLGVVEELVDPVVAAAVDERFEVPGDVGAGAVRRR